MTLQRICKTLGCKELTRERDGYCSAHRTSRWQQHQRGRTPTQRGYGSRWQRLRELVISRDSGLCQRCLANGQPVPGREVDHIVPKSQGGSDDMVNLQLLCRSCHASKTALESRGEGGFEVGAAVR